MGGSISGEVTHGAANQFNLFNSTPPHRQTCRFNQDDVRPFMKSRSQILLDKAVAAMVSAIEIYNKPDFPYREESFSILTINGWELLLKAKWLTENNNKLQSLYARYYPKNKDGSKSKSRRIKRNRSGNPLAHDVGYLSRKLVEKRHLASNVRTNIEILVEHRNSSSHFYNSSREFSNKLQPIGAACVKNFASIMYEWFDHDLREFNLHLMPLSFVAPPTTTKAVVYNREEKNFLKYLRQHVENADNADSDYFVTIDVQVKFTRSKTRDSLDVHVTSDPNATPIRLTQEQILETYPWTFKDLTAHCQERYSDFKCNQEYHDIRKSLCQDKDKDVCKNHYHNPKNPNSNYTVFYKSSILNEFDKYYKRKAG